MFKFFYNKRIQINLFILVSILISGLILFGLISYFSTRTVMIKGPYYNQIISSHDLIADILPPPYYIIETHLTSYQELAAKDRKELDNLIKKTNKLMQEYNERQAYWKEHLPKGKLYDILVIRSSDVVRKYFTTWQQNFLPLVKENKYDLARQELEGELTVLYDDHRQLIDEATKIANEQNEALEQAVSNVYQTTQQIAFLAWIATFAIGIFVAWILSHAITKRVKDVSKEIFPIYSELNACMDEQGQVMAKQLAVVNDTTVTMDELNASFRHTDSLAMDASSRASESMKIAEEGHDKIQQIVRILLVQKDKATEIASKIHQLIEVTRQIHSIANVISNLTNQTNILALNAAVHAVHTKLQGQGEGFSVIASEIRKLADDSKKFLSHIDVLAENIQASVSQTNNLAEESKKGIEEVLTHIEDTARSFGRVAEITTASSETASQVSANVKQQNLAVAHVVNGMENINEVSRAANARVQEVYALLNKLNSLARDLNQIVQD